VAGIALRSSVVATRRTVALIGSSDSFRRAIASSRQVLKVLATPADYEVDFQISFFHFFFFFFLFKKKKKKKKTYSFQWLHFLPS
jgi:hypothetical protein